jgi:hypothetical protein
MRLLVLKVFYATTGTPGRRPTEVRKARTIATLVCLIGSAAYTSDSAQAQAEEAKPLRRNI